MTDSCTICGLNVSRGSLQVHLDDVMGRAARGEGAWLLTLNTEMLARSVREPEYLRLMNSADIITADGMPLVWASRFKGPGAAIDGRTTGVDLVDAFLRSDEIPAFAVIGGKTPSVTIQAYGPHAMQACQYVFEDKVDLGEVQLSMFCRELEQRDVKVVFIALGVPKQDHLAWMLRKRMPNLVLTGIGGSFEILGPEGGRAPAWMQQAGLEWMYRFSKEPARLWKRYLVSYPVGIWHVLKDCMGLRA